MGFSASSALPPHNKQQNHAKLYKFLFDLIKIQGLPRGNTQYSSSYKVFSIHCRILISLAKILSLLLGLPVVCSLLLDLAQNCTIHLASRYTHPIEEEAVTAQNKDTKRRKTSAKKQTKQTSSRQQQRQNLRSKPGLKRKRIEQRTFKGNKTAEKFVKCVNVFASSRVFCAIASSTTSQPLRL